MADLIAWVSTLFSSVLQKLGFLNKEATLVLLGLDNAGKTTLQYKLKNGNVQSFVPTQRAKEEHISVCGLTIHAWDLGGHAAARHLWKKYSMMADGIVFIIDSADEERIGEARVELHRLVNAMVGKLQDCPLVVIANKSDLPSALTRDRLVIALDLASLPLHKLEIFPASVVKGTGYTEAFQWLSEQLP